MINKATQTAVSSSQGAVIKVGPGRKAGSQCMESQRREKHLEVEGPGKVLIFYKHRVKVRLEKLPLF